MLFPFGRIFVEKEYGVEVANVITKKAHQVAKQVYYLTFKFCIYEPDHDFVILTLLMPSL